MKRLIRLIGLFAVTSLTHGQVFTNLDFEMAEPGPLPTDPWFIREVPTTNAFPHWEDRVASSPRGFAYYDSVMDIPSFAITDALMPPHQNTWGEPYVISDRFSAVMVTYVSPPAEASLAQTGVVPMGTQSLRFRTSPYNLMQNPGFRPDLWRITVRVNGNEFAARLVQVETNALLWAVDLTRHQGQRVELRLGVQVWSPKKPHLSLTQYAAVAIDDLEFTPEPVPELPNAQNRSIVEWGENFGAVAMPAGISNVFSIAAGGWHRTVLTSDGRVHVWGDPWEFKTVVPSALSNLVAVAAGHRETLVIDRTGRVYGWPSTNIPVSLTNVAAVASGNSNGLALKRDGTIEAWGESPTDAAYWGVMYFGPRPKTPTGLSNIVAVAAGGVHNLALKADGSVAVWGINDRGQTNLPATATNLVAIAAGGLHSLALRSDGLVVAWGDNTYGQTNVPAGLTNVVGVAAGDYHSVALLSDGTVRAWGDNEHGQTNVPPGLTNVIDISANGAQNLALVGDTPPTPNLVPKAFWIEDSNFKLLVSSRSGRSYRLEHASDLHRGEWVAQPLVAGMGLDLELSAPVTTPAAFYRIRSW